MDPAIIAGLFEIGGQIIKHIWEAIERGDSAELRRLADVWPEPIAARLALLAQEAQIRQRAREQ